MKTLFNQKLLLLAISLFAITACEDDDKIKTTGHLSLDSEETKVASGWFLYDTSPNQDSEENDYYRNQLILVGKGLKVEKDGDDYDVDGNGDVLTLLINNEDQGLQVGTYTWQSEENEQPFDLWDGNYIQNMNTEDEINYRLYSGILTVSKSGSKYKINFEGLAYIEIETDGFKSAAGLPAIPVSAEFEGKLHKGPFGF